MRHVSYRTGIKGGSYAIELKNDKWKWHQAITYCPDNVMRKEIVRVPFVITGARWANTLKFYVNLEAATIHGRQGARCYRSDFCILLSLQK